MTAAPPDVESLLVAWLSAALAPIPVATDLPDDLGEPDVLQVVQVNALPTQGEPPAWNGPVLLYRPVVDLDFYAATRTEALDLALRTLGLLPDLRGHVSPYGRVSDVTPPPTPSVRPDFNDRVRRYGAAVSFTLRA